MSIMKKNRRGLEDSSAVDGERVAEVASQGRLFRDWATSVSQEPQPLGNRFRLLQPRSRPFTGAGTDRAAYRRLLPNMRGRLTSTADINSAGRQQLRALVSVSSNLAAADR